MQHNLSMEQFHGKGPEALFPAGSYDVRPAPWPQMSRSKLVGDYDPELVSQVLREPPRLDEVDPRSLHATQRSITKQGLHYYLASDYHRTGVTYADQGNEGNRFPVVYHREPGPNGKSESIILSGHHRAAAALVRGEPLRARTVSGPWGQKRQ